MLWGRVELGVGYRSLFQLSPSEATECRPAIGGVVGPVAARRAFVGRLAERRRSPWFLAAALGQPTRAERAGRGESPRRGASDVARESSDPALPPRPTARDRSGRNRRRDEDRGIRSLRYVRPDRHVAAAVRSSGAADRAWLTSALAGRWCRWHWGARRWLQATAVSQGLGLSRPTGAFQLDSLLATPSPESAAAGSSWGFAWLRSPAGGTLWSGISRDYATGPPGPERVTIGVKPRARSVGAGPLAPTVGDCPGPALPHSLDAGVDLKPVADDRAIGSALDLSLAPSARSASTRSTGEPPARSTRI
ncbi:MAG: hypothetical protein HY329_12450, partial [Chloroflexi bacterium]|nr:hypothetical protein [Chloroflexota bacterium]